MIIKANFGLAFGRDPKMRVGVGVVTLLVYATLSLWRFSKDSSHTFQAGAEKSFHGSRFDPRDFERVDYIVKARESEAFKDRLRKGSSADLSWPGLASAQVSWTWLELLQGLHNESSYQGDFSWMFSKLNTVIKNSHKSEKRFVGSLASFFYAIGRDHAGATVLMNELFLRSSDIFHSWFWGGYHAYYNLANRALAADSYGRAAQFTEGADYLAALSARLRFGSDPISTLEKRHILEKSMDPVFLEKLKRAKPDWFDSK